MERGQVVFIPCRFTRAGFPSERVFEIQAPGDGVYNGVVPLSYCYTEDKKPLKGEPEPERKRWVDGFLVGVIVNAPVADVVRVHLPDGDVCEIRTELLYLTEGTARVSLQS